MIIKHYQILVLYLAFLLKVSFKNLLFRYQSQGNWEVSEGSFITNLDIRYDKAKGEKDITEEQDTDNDNDADTKALISYYEHKNCPENSIWQK